MEDKKKPALALVGDGNASLLTYAKSILWAPSGLFVPISETPGAWDGTTVGYFQIMMPDGTPCFEVVMFDHADMVTSVAPTAQWLQRGDWVYYLYRKNGTTAIARKNLATPQGDEVDLTALCSLPSMTISGWDVSSDNSELYLTGSYPSGEAVAGKVSLLTRAWTPLEAGAKPGLICAMN